MLVVHVALLATYMYLKTYECIRESNIYPMLRNLYSQFRFEHGDSETNWFVSNLPEQKFCPVWNEQLTIEIRNISYLIDTEPGRIWVRIKRMRNWRQIETNACRIKLKRNKRFVSNFVSNRNEKLSSYLISVCDHAFWNELFFVSSSFLTGFRYEISQFRYEIFRI